MRVGWVAFGREEWVRMSLRTLRGSIGGGAAEGGWLGCKWKLDEDRWW